MASLTTSWLFSFRLFGSFVPAAIPEICAAQHLENDWAPAELAAGRRLSCGLCRGKQGEYAWHPAS